MSFDGVRPMGAWDTKRAAELHQANAKRKPDERFKTTADLLAARMEDTGNDQVILLGDSQCALDAAGVVQIINPEKYGPYVREGEKGFADSYKKRLKLANEMLKEKKMSATSVPTGTVFDLNKYAKDSSKKASDTERKEAILSILQGAEDLKNVKFLDKTTVTDLAKVIIENSNKKEYKNIKLGTPEGQRQFDKLVKALRDDAGLKGFDLTLSEKNQLDLSKYFAKAPDSGETQGKADAEVRSAEDIYAEIGDDKKLDVQSDDTPMKIARAIVLKLQQEDSNSNVDHLNLEDSDKKLANDKDFKPILAAVQKELGMQGKDYGSKVGENNAGEHDFSEAYQLGVKPEKTDKADAPENRDEYGIRDALDENQNLDVQSDDTPMEIARGIALKLKEDAKKDGSNIDEDYANLDLSLDDEDLAADAKFQPILKAVQEKLGMTEEGDYNSEIGEEKAGKTYNFEDAYNLGLKQEDATKGRDVETLKQDIIKLGKGDLNELEHFDIQKGDTPQAVLDAIKDINAEGGLQLDEEDLLAELQEKMGVEAPDEGVKADGSISLKAYFTKDDPDFKFSTEEIAKEIQSDGTLATKPDYTNYDIARAVVLKHKNAGNSGDENLRGLNLDDQAALANDEAFKKLLGEVAALTEQEDNTASIGLKDLNLSQLLP
jgi:chorismate mutase